ncbi:MAG: phosphopantothenoylcysteine decarboxylase domain-containing protein [Planctomycetaceae bacterium]
MRVLVTAGPTREPIDPVRYLSNRSTGAMGFALAREALRRGHAVSLVLGPVAGAAPQGADVTAVETAREMLAAALAELPRCDAIVCAAAVSDVRPAEASVRKIKRGALRRIDLVENPDVAQELGARRGKRPVAIFALETGEGETEARAKLVRKNADLCVLNGPEAIGAARARFRLLPRTGGVRDLGTIDKASLAAALFDALGI